MMMMMKIAVTGAGGGVGGAVLRSLKKYQTPMEIIGLDMAPYAPGLYYAKRGYLVPSAGSIRYQSAVLDICRKENINVLIIGTDPELVPISSMKSELDSIGCIPICSGTQVNKLCRNKFDCSKTLSEAGFPFVKTVMAKDIDVLIESSGFPIILKPLSGSASAGTFVIFNRQEVNQVKAPENYIAQEYLVPASWGKSKKDLLLDDVQSYGTILQKDEISIQILTGRSGEFLGCYSSKNVLKNGVPMLIESIQKDTSGAEEIAKDMASYLAGIGLRGPSNLQCKITEDGPVFFEINARFTGITAVRTAMRFREVEACIRSMVLGESAETIRAECLDTDHSQICSRYITEYFFPAADTTQAVERAKAFSNHNDVLTAKQSSGIDPVVCSVGGRSFYL